MYTFFWIWIRRLLMIVVPTTLVILEWNHPSGFSNNVYDGLKDLGGWWRQLHIDQAFLFGGVAAAGFILTMHNFTIWGCLSKAFIWLFAVCYLVFDSTGGIAVGSIIEMSLQDSSLDLDTIKAVIQNLYNDPIIGGSGSFFSMTGSWGWLIGIAFAIVALYQENQSLPPWKLFIPLLLLGISAYTLYVGHYSPYGPIAFGSFALANIWFEIFRFGPARKI